MSALTCLNKLFDTRFSGYSGISTHDNHLNSEGCRYPERVNATKHKIMFKARKRMSLYLLYSNLDYLKLRRLVTQLTENQHLDCLELLVSSQRQTYNFIYIFLAIGIHRGFPKVVNLIYFL